MPAKIGTARAIICRGIDPCVRSRIVLDVAQAPLHVSQAAADAHCMYWIGIDLPTASASVRKLKPTRISDGSALAHVLANSNRRIITLFTASRAVNRA